MACIRISEYSKAKPHLGLQLLMTVHDEVVMECNEQYAQEVASEVTKLMESCADMCVPLVAEATIGKDYGQCK